MPLKHSNKLSNEFIEEFSKTLIGYISPNTLEKFFLLVQQELKYKYWDAETENNFYRILFSAYDKVSLINNILVYPSYLNAIIQISINSNFLSNILVGNPEYIHIIAKEEYLKTRLDESKLYLEIQNSTSSFKSFEAKLNALKRIKRRLILEIAAKDMFGYLELKEVTKELSLLAKTILKNFFEICIVEVEKKYHIRKTINDYLIICLGKTGGNELNYSSDVDIIVIYEEDKLLNKTQYKTILTEAVKLFSTHSNAFTSSGYLYRIDLRLRPHGKNSSLVKSLAECFNYYENKGEPWERQMLIKMDYLCGNHELYYKFSNFVKHFVYPSSTTLSPNEQIKTLKRKIEINNPEELNIKLSKGGIRDIEFSIQALQLLFGGINPELRTGNTLDALHNLCKYDLITSDEKENLTEAYLFYRQIEHFAQLLNDTQIHNIPEGNDFLKLVSYLNLTDINKFNTKLSKSKKFARKFYSSVVGEERVSSLDHINFKDPKKANKDYNLIKEGIGITGESSFDETTITSFTKIEDEVISILEKADDPDKILSNFVKIINNISTISLWFKQLENKKLLQDFLLICEKNQLFVDLVSHDDYLKENIITGRYLVKDSEEFSSIRSLIAFLSFNYLKKNITENEVSNKIAFYIHKAILKKVDKLFKDEKEYLILGMGSFGNDEMNFYSDVDLVFINCSAKSLNTSFNNLNKDLSKELYPFEIDFKLRPEGKSSQLVWSYENYLLYIEKRIRIWELQSFTKVRYIAGNKELFFGIINKIKQRISNLTSLELKQSIVTMRNEVSRLVRSDIKRIRGGFAEIENILQYNLLKDSNLFVSCYGKNFLEILQILKTITQEDCKELTENYIFLKKIIFLNQILFNRKKLNLVEDKNELCLIGKELGWSNDNFLNKIDELLKKNMYLFEKYIV